MLTILSTLLLAGSLIAQSSEERHTDAVEIFYRDFSPKEDVNFDKWPDNWRRTFGSGMPHYVDVALEADETAVAGHCLSVFLNGGGAKISSQPVAISDNFGYVAEARLRGSGVRQSRARVQIEFCDENLAVIKTASSPWFRDTGDWEKISIGPVNVINANVRFAVITMVIEQPDGFDLKGKFSLDDVWFARLPRMTVTTNSPFNVYDNPNKVVVTCELSGILEQDPDIHFELLDASSQRIKDNTIQLKGRLITEKLSKTSDFIANLNEKDRTERPDGYAGSTQWSPPITEYGFYLVKVAMKTARGTPQEHVISIAVVPPMKPTFRGEFGWSLADDRIPLSFENLSKLLPNTGVSWVKLPVWYGQSEAERGDQLVLFAEQLSAKDIDIVGVLDRPPGDLDFFGKELPETTSIADIFTNYDSSVWLPSLDEVLTRLSLRVRWWQLGDDTDTSYAFYPNAEREVAALREKLFRFGQDVNLGIGWPWLLEPSSQAQPSWDFQQQSARPSLSGEELATYLELPKRRGVNRWTTIEPLSRHDYSLETRIRDLMEQMLAAKIGGAEAIFASQPFDNEHGLMTDQGTPGDLLLPWRTAASLLSGAQYLGSIELPGGSENQLFKDEHGMILMVVWNETPREETIYLGDNVEVKNVWGQSETPRMNGSRQVIEVTELPKFVVGMSAPVAEMRMAAKFENLNIPSVFEHAHLNQLELRNTFPQGIGGVVRIIPPEGWQIIPNQLDFKLATQDKARRPFQIVLPFDAISGPTPIRIDCEFTAEKPYSFSIYRELTVGDDDLELELTTRLDDDGTLIAEQRMINHGPRPADFKCFLYAPERRRQRMQVFQLTNNWDVKTYKYPNGENLLGQELLLRTEELGGKRRVLNHRVLVEE